MSERKNLVILTGFVLSVSLFTASLTALLLTRYFGRAHMRTLEEICGGILDEQPEAEQAVLSALKEYKVKGCDLQGYEPEERVSQECGSGEYETKGSTPAENLTEGYGSVQAELPERDILQAYGYTQTDFLRPAGTYVMLCAAAGFLVSGTLFAFTLLLRRRKETARIKFLTGYLEKVNTGGGGILPLAGEDEFSKLQDEIYKTVTELYQTRDAALKAKRNFADNLYNIAHQIKTPITSISLSAQMMRGDISPEHLEQIKKQLSRLTHLEEALLLLSRIDAGTLSLNKRETDVYTLLMLAADNLQELLSGASVSVDIPESGEATIHADLDWTMEAVMNLLKNCMEHTPPGGVIRCLYEQNPLYTQIRIYDTGSGFAEEDIPHLFERFYRGQNAQGDGTGIGLFLSKAIIESQNGTITAGNLTEGGACFEIRFYSH